jgi:hypothetical protein
MEANYFGVRVLPYAAEKQEDLQLIRVTSTASLKLLGKYALTINRSDRPLEYREKNVGTDLKTPPPILKSQHDLSLRKVFSL